LVGTGRSDLLRFQQHEIDKNFGQELKERKEHSKNHPRTKFEIGDPIKVYRRSIHRIQAETVKEVK